MRRRCKDTGRKRTGIIVMIICARRQNVVINDSQLMHFRRPPVNGNNSYTRISPSAGDVKRERACPASPAIHIIISIPPGDFIKNRRKRLVDYTDRTFSATSPPWPKPLTLYNSQIKCVNLRKKKDTAQKEKYFSFISVTSIVLGINNIADTGILHRTFSCPSVFIYIGPDLTYGV